jgi:hypothetical protein
MVDCVGVVIAGARVAASTQNEGARKISSGRNLASGLESSMRRTDVIKKHAQGQMHHN